MDKETEIKHLRALQQGDTYFAQFFKSDVDRMVQNIQNDFPIVENPERTDPVRQVLIDPLKLF